MKDLTGLTFNHLTFVSFSHREGGRYFWNMQCSCGVQKKMSCVSDIQSGAVVSCGHYRVERKINHTHGGTYTKEYRIWKNMRDRCNNKNNKDWVRYGGRGITVCSEWYDFATFFKDMGKCPEGMTLDRKDNDKGYCAINCRWATHKEQQANRSNSGDNRKHMVLFFKVREDFVKNLELSNRKLASKYGTDHKSIAEWRTRV